MASLFFEVIDAPVLVGFPCCYGATWPASQDLDKTKPDELREGREVVAVPHDLYVWTDGSLVQDQVSGASSSGSGFYAHLPSVYWDRRRCGHMDEIRSDDGVVQSCTGLCSVPGPLQSVQGPSSGRVILALQASAPLHLGVDNLDVVRRVGRLLEGVRHLCPSELVKDGDLILLIDRILCKRRRDKVRVTKVKGHANEDMVQAGGVRELDRIGNNGC